MLKVIESDLFSQPVDVIITSCNCFNTMGGGVAWVIRQEYPGAWQADQNTIKGDRSKLGTFTSWTGNHARLPNRTVTIVNLYGQYDYGTNKVNADYDAIKRGLEAVNRTFTNNVIGLPFAGAGLAKGSPVVLFSIFKEVFDNSPNQVFLCLRHGEFTEFLGK